MPFSFPTSGDLLNSSHDILEVVICSRKTTKLDQEPSNKSMFLPMFVQVGFASCNLQKMLLEFTPYMHLASFQSRPAPQRIRLLQGMHSATSVCSSVEVRCGLLGWALVAEQGHRQTSILTPTPALISVRPCVLG